MLWVEEFGVNALGSLISTADNEDFCRDIPRGRGLGRFYGREQLLENPQQGVVVLRSENLGHKRTTLV